MFPRPRTISFRASLVLACLPQISVAQEGADTDMAGTEPTAQFQIVEGAFPGPTYWTEAVAFGDIENDGDLDVFFARGEGWTDPGRKHQNGLYLNKLEEAPFTFEDVSIARLGYAESHAKSVVTADVNGDGFIDVLFVNSFNSAPPHLFINRGASRSGYFKQESDLRGLSEALTSGNAAFGDPDNDGDLDLVLSDGGPIFLAAPGGRTRLYENVGDGFFRETPDRIGAPVKVGPMGVHLVDIDNDFDVDYFGPNRSGSSETGHYLMENNGSGYFYDVSAKLPETTGGVYEADVADLDGDGDLDLFFTSLSETKTEATRFPLGEGPMRNRLIEDGVLGFEKGEAIGADDDNDIALLDYDQDGDLDAIIASLGPREKMFRNDGDLKFALVDGVIEVVADPSLDLGLADLDNDGRVDLVTAQGLERIGAEQPPCQLFRNTGPRDERPPKVLAAEILTDPQPTAGPWVVRARVQDDVVCNMDTFVTGEIYYVLSAAPLRVEVVISYERIDQHVAAGTTLVIKNTTGAPATIWSEDPDPIVTATELAAGAEVELILARQGLLKVVREGDDRPLEIVVTGEAWPGKALAAGTGLWRFELPRGHVDAKELVYQMIFRDRAGNRTVGDATRVRLSDERPDRRRRRP